MKLLLDTHTLLWHADGNPSLSATAAALLVDPGNELCLSVVSIWETAIKAGLMKLTLSADFDAFMTRAIDGYGIKVVPIAYEDCSAYQQLTFPDPKHRDPFDRMIVVQVARHKMQLVSADAAFDAYGIHRLW